jgi:molecular chaperone GrpE
MTEEKNEEISETGDKPDPVAGAGSAEANAPDGEKRDGDAGETAEAAGDKTVPEAEITPEEEVAELKDKLLRALAENENLIRRARKDREDATKYAAANFARDMLGVADNLHRALDAVPQELREGDDATKAFLEGVDLTARELLSTLERHGIQKLSPLGEKFDHDRHEALFEVPTGEAAPGTVVQVMEEGYIIHDRLLRAARVGIAKALTDTGEDKERQVDTTA